MDRLLSCFPHSIAKNKRWPADTSSGLLQKMCAEDASSDFLLWICSASPAHFPAIEPGECDMAGPRLLWVWPHSRQCLLVPLSSSAVFGAEAALWPCVVLSSPVLSHANLLPALVGDLKASPGCLSRYSQSVSSVHILLIRPKSWLPAAEWSGLICVLVQASADGELRVTQMWLPWGLEFLSFSAQSLLLQKEACCHSQFLALWACGDPTSVHRICSTAWIIYDVSFSLWGKRI